MKESPILFSGAMVRAILEGCKTQTRRVMKPRPVTEVRSGAVGHWSIAPDVREFICPYGQPGDRLWVKEAWSLPCIFDSLKPSDPALGPPAKGVIRYLADGNKSGKTRVSIHMTRWASRILLEITDVRAERIQDISLADAKAEGTPGQMPDGKPFEVFTSFRDRFQFLWNGINAARGFGWDTNPWVWVIEFKRIA